VCSPRMSTPPLAVTLSATIIINGTGPVVLLGANGAGKTRLGTRLVDLNAGATRIPAHRLLVVGTYSVSPMSAARDLENHRTHLLREPWQMATEFDQVFVKMLADTAGSSLRSERARETDPQAPAPPPTPIGRVDRLWREVFPARHLDINPGLDVVSTLSGAEAHYPAAEMSDGERTALYLALACLDAKPGVVIVDEPTIHLHPELARRFWNAVERERADCRFVYITHDLEFALSRRDSRIVVKRPGDNNLTLISEHSSVPKDVLAALLGAASFAVIASRIVVCEGSSSGDDETFYSAWFNDRDTVVVPLGTSTHVMNAHTTMLSDKLIKGANLVPIVDRDDHPGEHLDKLTAKASSC
jgi:hypothetical protein